MLILAIETSCDETAAAVLQDTKILSSVRYSQKEHAAWGGVVPSIAKREHETRIDGVIDSAISKSQIPISKIDAIAVTVGPGLAIALEVGIKTAKELAAKYHKKLIAVNHIEGHILSPLISPPIPPLKLRGRSEEGVMFPCLALVVSGGHTELDLVEKIGTYKILAETIDDALGEALDKAARLLDLPYPGGMLLEKAAQTGNPKTYQLPLPMAGKEDQNHFSYSGLKTAFSRLIQQVGLENVNDLAAVFQNRAFEHLIRVIRKTIINTSPHPSPNLGEGVGGRGISDLLVGGGVIANQELRKRLEQLGQELGLQVHFSPMELTGDNAAMIGLAAYFKAQKGQFVKDFTKLDRLPRWRVDQNITPPAGHPS